MAIDPQYVVAPDLQTYFVDKTTGLPLAFGKVYFYEPDGTTPKPVYTIANLPTDPPTYIPLDNPMILSAVGTPTDPSGNDVIIYYKPFDANGVLQLYYIKVFDQNDVPQFVRFPWPNIDSGENPVDDVEILNFIPNGQFLAHNELFVNGLNVLPPTTFPPTFPTNTVFDVAPGGWTFERNTGSSATDIITFLRTPNYTNAPSGSPRYSVEINRTAASPDSICDLRIKFNDVNTFAGETLTFLFNGYNIGSNLPNVQVYLIKYFGTNGSTPTADPIGNAITFLQQTQQFAINIDFPTNGGFNIAPLQDDDFVQIAIRFPTTSIFNVVITDVMLVTSPDGPIPTVVDFPITTNNEILQGALAGSIPAPANDGSNLYLPILLTPNGFGYDTSNIGKIYASPFDVLDIGELLCDGTSYPISSYSTDGIPYSRLAAKAWDPTLGNYIFGTGYQYATANISASNNTAFYLNLNNSTSTPVTPPTDAGSSTYTFSPVVTGIQLNQVANVIGFNLIAVRTTVEGTTTPPLPVSSGFTINTVLEVSTTALKYTIQTISGASIPQSSYFTFSIGVTNYYVWFNKAGGGMDPAPGGTGIQVNITGAESSTEIAQIMLWVMNGWQTYLVTCASGPTPVAGSYFDFDTNSNNNHYSVWFNVNGSGSAPANGRTPIEVVILSTNTSDQNCKVTAEAINMFQIGTPDLRGVFLRGLDPNSMFDFNSPIRGSYIAQLYGNQLATYEDDTNLMHLHSNDFSVSTTGSITATVPLHTGYTVTAGSGADNAVTTANTAVAVTNGLAYVVNGGVLYEGSTESKPLNYSINWVMKY